MKLPLVTRRRYERDMDELIDHAADVEAAAARARRICDMARRDTRRMFRHLARAKDERNRAQARAARAEHRCTVLEDAIREHRDDTARGFALSADNRLHAHLPDHQETT